MYERERECVCVCNVMLFSINKKVLLRGDIVYCKLFEISISCDEYFIYICIRNIVALVLFYEFLC